MLATELQYAVRSLTRGRARIRHERLRGLDNETCTNIESFLLGLEGVTGCALNPRVGSLLVTWDETKKQRALSRSPKRLGPRAQANS